MDIDPALYQSPAWLALRAAILRRDGHCCRNCSSGEELQVHHWTPLPEHRGEVDESGYGRGENPLIVDESGLITLCRLCHEAMTERRTRQAALKHPSLRQLGDPAKKSDNIFELWALNGRRTPFLVRKDTWNAGVDHRAQIGREFTCAAGTTQPTPRANRGRR